MSDGAPIDRLAREFPPCPPRPAGAPTALDGVLVADFSHFIAGPLATMFLADMGAEVVKIEPPGRGDELRHYPPVIAPLPAQGGPYVWGNRNKRSVALDLKTSAGREVARDIVARADVLVENFSTGVMERFGLDYDACRGINRRLVYCSISAYGREGALADRLGMDPVVQAESGFVSMNGYADRLGVRASSPVMDIGTAMMACNAILGALYARTHLGEGQFVEVALYDTAMLMTGWATMQYLFTGVEPRRHGNTSPDTCPSGVFEAQDQAFYINCGNDRIFHRLVTQVLDRPDLAEDPVLAHRDGRAARRDELFRTLGEEFALRPWKHWHERMRAAQIPCGEVRSVAEALRSQESRERHIATWIPHPAVGRMPNIASPIRFRSTPVVDPVPAPTVGQHTDEVLQEVLGWNAERIQGMARRGAFGAAPDQPDARK